jgi:hypothetical protein
MRTRSRAARKHRAQTYVSQIIKTDPPHFVNTGGGPTWTPNNVTLNYQGSSTNFIFDAIDAGGILGKIAEATISPANYATQNGDPVISIKLTRADAVGVNAGANNGYLYYTAYTGNPTYGTVLKTDDPTHSKVLDFTVGTTYMFQSATANWSDYNTSYYRGTQRTMIAFRIKFTDLTRLHAWVPFGLDNSPFLGPTLGLHQYSNNNWWASANVSPLDTGVPVSVGSWLSVVFVADVVDGQALYINDSTTPVWTAPAVPLYGNPTRALGLTSWYGGFWPKTLIRRAIYAVDYDNTQATVPNVMTWLGAA